MQQQQLQRMQELAPLEEEDADQEPLLSQGLRDKIAGEPWLRAQVRQDFKDISIDHFAKILSFAAIQAGFPESRIDPTISRVPLHYCVPLCRGPEVPKA